MSDSYALTVINLENGSFDKASGFFEEFVLKLDVNYAKEILQNDRVLDLVFKPSDPQHVKGLLKTIEKPTNCDVIFQKQETRKNKKLFIFDMDSTLIYQEVIELIAEYANIQDKVAEITERAMNGELDFNQSLFERVLLLKGINAASIWDELKHKIKITKGAKELCKALSKLDVVMGVCSGGFIPLAEHIKEELGLNYAYANQLGTDENQFLDGTTIGPIVNGDKKAELLLEISQKHGIEPEDAVAVGDGANDLKMMSVAGFGVAWNAKPKVQSIAPSCLNSDSLQDILYIMGFTSQEIDELTN